VTPLAEWVFETFDGKSQLIALYFTNGTLSFISDNVFIATVFITEVESAYVGGIIAQMIGDIRVAFDDGAEALEECLRLIHEGKSAYNSDIITNFIHYIDAASADGTLNLELISSIQAEYADKTVMTREEYEKLAVVVNMGTNIPAMATPNGHAALLFLLTSSLAPLLGLSYFRMFLLALPYTIAMTITGAAAIYFFL
jgi:NhaB family Na+:H+ antiporter